MVGRGGLHLREGDSTCLPGSHPGPQSHCTETLQHPKRKLCVLHMRKVRFEEVMQPAPVLPQLHPEQVWCSWGLNLSHLSFQKTSPIYLGKRSASRTVHEVSGEGARREDYEWKTGESCFRGYQVIVGLRHPSAAWFFLGGRPI